jgi:hypothetical protein
VAGNLGDSWISNGKRRCDLFVDLFDRRDWDLGCAARFCGQTEVLWTDRPATLRAASTDLNRKILSESWQRVPRATHPLDVVSR